MKNKYFLRKSILQKLLTFTNNFFQNGHLCIDFHLLCVSLMQVPKIFVPSNCSLQLIFPLYFKLTTANINSCQRQFSLILYTDMKKYHCTSFQVPSMFRLRNSQKSSGLGLGRVRSISLNNWYREKYISRSR